MIDSMHADDQRADKSEIRASRYVDRIALENDLAQERQTHFRVLAAIRAEAQQIKREEELRHRQRLKEIYASHRRRSG